MKTILALGLSALVAYGMCVSLARACGDAECEAAWRAGFLNAQADCVPLSPAQRVELRKMSASGDPYFIGNYDFHMLDVDQGHATACMMAGEVFSGRLPYTERARAEDDCNVGVLAVYAERKGDGLVCMYRQ